MSSSLYLLCFQSVEGRTTQCNSDGLKGADSKKKWSIGMLKYLYSPLIHLLIHCDTDIFFSLLLPKIRMSFTPLTGNDMDNPWGLHCKRAQAVLEHLERPRLESTKICSLSLSLSLCTFCSAVSLRWCSITKDSRSGWANFNAFSTKVDLTMHCHCLFWSRWKNLVGQSANHKLSATLRFGRHYIPHLKQCAKALKPMSCNLLESRCWASCRNCEEADKE